MKKDKKFWNKYRKQAAEHFQVSTSTIDYRLKQADPDLINWLEQKSLIRQEAKNKLLNLIESNSNENR